MRHWTSDLHALLLQISAGMNRPDVDERFLRAANSELDRELFPLLSRIAAASIGIVELAAQVGRTHSTVSRQVAKLERQGSWSGARQPRTVHPALAPRSKGRSADRQIHRNPSPLDGRSFQGLVGGGPEDADRPVEEGRRPTGEDRVNLAERCHDRFDRKE